MSPIANAALVLLLATLRNAVFAPFIDPCRFRAHCGKTDEQKNTMKATRRSPDHT